MSMSFDRVANMYDATRKIPPDVGQQIADSIAHVSGATLETRFLDVGIGTGRIAFPLIRCGYSYTGLDKSEAMMAELRRKLERVPNRLTLVQGDLTDMPFEDSAFDVVIAVRVLHLVPEWKVALAEIRRVLRPGGLFLYCSDAVLDRDQPFYERWRELLESHGFVTRSPGGTRADVLGALQEQGATLKASTAVEWSFERTIGEILDSFRRRLLSSLWQIPDSVFDPAISDLEDWVRESYPSMDTVICSDVKFEIVAVHDWA